MTGDKSDGEFKVDRIDHVELLVADRHAAAAWYAEALGLEIIREFEFWADDENGPLMISSDEGSTKLALFQEDVAPANRRGGIIRVAFHVDGGGFVHFMERLSSLTVADRDGHRVTRRDVVDHERSWSIYFTDPDGNPLEVTTYDYDFVAKTLF